MKKVGLITSWKDNFGSILQCFSTKLFLKKHGVFCDVLYEKASGINKINRTLRRSFSLLVHSFLPGFIKNYLKGKKLYKNSSKKMSGKSITACKKFIESRIQPYGVSLEYLRRVSKTEEYSLFLCGSDQIWNFDLGQIGPFSFLQFAPAKKRYALAPSFGTYDVNKFCRRKAKRFLKQFELLSVREERGAEIIKELTGREAEVLCDPVMLLEKREWEELFANKEPILSEYVFVHFLDAPSPVAMDSIKRASSCKKIIAFAYWHKEYESIDNLEFLDGGPEDYLFYIKNARTVFTDSFHTSQFSLIFETNFYVFRRQYQFNQNQNSRIDNLLSKYGMTDRIVENSETAIELDGALPQSVEVISDNNRSKIRGYLTSVLGIKQDKNVSLKSNDFCCGCGACLEVCPVNAISFESGLFDRRIQIGDNCIKCGKCVSTCSREVLQDRAFKKEGYVASSCSDDLLKISASGGVFSSIATSFLESGGVVFGAKLFLDGERTTCDFIEVKDTGELPSILKSKYVESNMHKQFATILKRLENGTKVLVCGTSCQIDGLLRFLPKKYENLYTIDLVCHGVPSIQLFKKYIVDLEKQNKAKVISFDFRIKKDGHVQYTENIRFSKNGSCFDKNIECKSSPYYRMFLACDSYRNKCYTCDFSFDNKPADLTIGDYFEVFHDYPDLKNSLSFSKGVSCVITNTEKGKKLLNTYGGLLHLFGADVETIVFSHEQLLHPSRPTEDKSNIRKKAQKSLKLVSHKYRQTDLVIKIGNIFKRLVGK